MPTKLFKGAILFTIGTQIFAGNLHTIWCETKGCDYKVTIAIGGGMYYYRVLGYCKKCEKFVAWEWYPNKEKKKNNFSGTIFTFSSKTVSCPPTPLVKFYDPLRGYERSIYPCPICRSPFIEIRGGPDFEYCPKCGKPGLHSKMEAFEFD